MIDHRKTLDSGTEGPKRMSIGTIVDKVTGQKRAYALDALRGSAILMMVLSEMNPYSRTNHLPSFMYHAQVPPPDFIFNPKAPPPGVTWVDMVLPFFLFSMGAAIPFAIGRRIEKGVGTRGIVVSTLLRGLLLALFAFYVEHIKTYSMVGGRYTLFLIGITGFLLPFIVLGRLPSDWKPGVRTAVKAAGWIGAVALLLLSRHKDSYANVFSIERYDVIIVILANVAVYTTLIYLATRKNLLMRAGIMGIMIAMKLGTSVPGWVHSLYANFPIPYVNAMKSLGPSAVSVLKAFNFFFSLEITHYLFIAIPGTIVGDMVLQWMNAPETGEREAGSWSKARYTGLALLLFGAVVLDLCLLKGRYVWQLAVALIPVLLAGNWLVRKPSASIERLINGLYKWGMYLLAVGILFEPYEGGIKKDGATMSYFFVSTGLAIFTLIVYTIIIDIFKGKRAVQLLIDNGQNPMIAYTAGGNFVGLILGTFWISDYLAKVVVTPWPSFAIAVCTTLLVALSVSFCTRRRLFWRT